MTPRKAKGLMTSSGNDWIETKLEDKTFYTTTVRGYALGLGMYSAGYREISMIVSNRCDLGRFLGAEITEKYSQLSKTPIIEIDKEGGPIFLISRDGIATIPAD